MFRRLFDPPFTAFPQSTATSSSLLFPTAWIPTAAPLFGRFAEQPTLTQRLPAYWVTNLLRSRQGREPTAPQNCNCCVRATNVTCHRLSDWSTQPHLDVVRWHASCDWWQPHVTATAVSVTSECDCKFVHPTNQLLLGKLPSGPQES